MASSMNRYRNQIDLKDALTSTVFGALVWTGSWDLLARWLQVGVEGDDETTAGIWDCWFWPTDGVRRARRSSSA